MKKFLFGLIATVFFGFSGNAQDKIFNGFFKSKEFTTLSEKFSLNEIEIDKVNVGLISHESKKYNIYRVLVKTKDFFDYITFFSDDNGFSYVLAYEKININEKVATHYDEFGNILATFNVELIDKQIKFTLNKYDLQKSSKSLLSNKRAGCVDRIYQALKNACSNDSVCDMLCDINPSCLPMLAGWAVGYCATH